MSSNAIAQCFAFMLVVTLLALPLGAFMARVFQGRAMFSQRLLGPIERRIYALCGVDVEQDMSWSQYASALLAFSFLGSVLAFALQRSQSWLPLNPAALPSVPPELAFNTAVSFVTNTDWQAYGGETTLSYCTQMLVLGTQSFVSAASGLAVLMALIRGFTRTGADGIGNFWVDVSKGTLYVLLPLSIVLALLLVAQGVVQSFGPYASAQLLQATRAADGAAITQQVLALGPAASQIAIKQLGTNGGGFFNANSAHPFENPTPIANFLELLAILLIPVALCFSFGALVRDRRQGWALYAAMTLVFLPLLAACVIAEQDGNPALSHLGVLQGGGNMEGKETRFGITNSALWATATTAASNGSVNAMHDSFTPLGGLVPLVLIQLGEVIYGGVGSGLYGMLVYAIIAVFIAGLMVGRTPEYLGKKIEAYEMKMASLVILFPVAAILVGTACACVLPAGSATLGNPGSHGFSEILYAFSSGAQNNGSAFAGITVSGTFYATAIGVVMWIGRFWLIVPVLAIAGSLARKQRVAHSSGTLPTHTPLFVTLLVGTVVLIGALTYFPALALGPVVEHLVLGAD